MSIHGTGAVAARPTERVLGALGTVIDPELDEPVTELGFVDALEVGADGDVRVVLRMPTPQCAPNFAYLMVHDARTAVLAVDGVRSARIELRDHYTAEEIVEAVHADSGFDGAFPGESRGDVDDLRVLFRRKALLGRQGRVAARLRGAGASEAELAALRLGDLEDEPEIRRCRVLRDELGIGAAPGDAAFVTADGAAVDREELPRFLRMSRLMSVSLESNGGICRSLLATRYDDAASAAAAGDAGRAADADVAPHVRARHPTPTNDTEVAA